jgi:pre-mRNA-splicing factor RBM22/SLT11
MLDLSFGLPITVRDAALKMVAPGPDSAINREYFAQNNERELEDGRGGLEAYEKTDDKARQLLKKLAGSGPYARARDENGPRRITNGSGESSRGSSGPVRTHSRNGPGGGGPRGGGKAGRTVMSKPPGPEDILPPADKTITSLFVTGVEEDLPEHTIKAFFANYGTLRSIVCSHRSHCAFINYQSRESAEAAAEALQGKAVIAGVPLRVRWGRPKPLGTMDDDERAAMRREGRQAQREHQTSQIEKRQNLPSEAVAAGIPVEKPPGADDDVKYASQAGA